MAHHETHACICKAENLLEEPTQDSLRYATLQLRMAIEYLFYELIPLYREELPDDIATSIWQPRQIIDALLECDPHVDQDAKIGIGVGSSMMVWQSKAPSKRLLRDRYHRLGSYLHAPVNLIPPPIDKWHSDLHETISCLRDFDVRQVVFNVRPVVEFPCKLCGRSIKRNKHGVEKTGEMRCQNSNCRAIYDVQLEPNKTHYTLRQVSYTCPYCKMLNYVSVGGIKEGSVITCDACEKRVVVRLGGLDPIDGDPALTTKGDVT